MYVNASSISIAGLEIFFKKIQGMSPLTWTPFSHYKAADLQAHNVLDLPFSEEHTSCTGKGGNLFII